MQTRFNARVDALAEAILRGQGDSPVHLRSAIFERAAAFAKPSLDQPPDTEILPEALSGIRIADGLDFEVPPRRTNSD